MDKVDEAIAATEPRTVAYVHVDFSDAGLKFDINGLDAWQLFGIIEILRMEAQRMHMETMMQAAASQKQSGLVAAPPGMRVNH